MLILSIIVCYFSEVALFHSVTSCSTYSKKHQSTCQSAIHFLPSGSLSTKKKVFITTGELSEERNCEQTKIMGRILHGLVGMY